MSVVRVHGVCLPLRRRALTERAVVATVATRGQHWLALEREKQSVPLWGAAVGGGSGGGVSECARPSRRGVCALVKRMQRSAKSSPVVQESGSARTLEYVASPKRNVWAAVVNHVTEDTCDDFAVVPPVDVNYRCLLKPGA